MDWNKTPRTFTHDSSKSSYTLELRFLLTWELKIKMGRRSIVKNYSVYSLNFGRLPPMSDSDPKIRPDGVGSFTVRFH